jgi:hypothetical protein
MKIELTDDEVTTIMVALDNYGTAKREEWMTTHDDDDLTQAGSAEWCWQKIYGQSEEQFNNSVADAVGEGETNNSTTAYVDPFGRLPTWNE